MMSLSLSLPESRRPRGRPPAGPDAARRRRHIRAAYLRLVGREPLAKVARRFRVGPRTIQLWVAKALTYDDPMALAIRNLIERGP